MKKFIYMMMIACTAVFSSCWNDENHGRDGGSSDNVDLSNLAATGRIGQVVLTWDNPTNPDYYYSMVSYVNAAGETVNQKVSYYSEDPDKGAGHTYAKILGFNDTKTYEFTVVPYTSYGVAGKAQTVSCAPEDAACAYKYIPETVTVEPAVEGAVVSWVNEYEIPVTVNISYKNLLGENVTVKVSSAESGSKTIGAFVDPTTITVTSSNQAGTATSDASSFQVTPAKGEIPYTNYSVIKNTGGYLGAGMEAEKMIDGVWSSTWHSNTSSAGDVTMVIDLSAVYQVAKVEFVKRTDDPDASGYPDVIKVLTSVDNENFTLAGTHEFDANYTFNHVCAFDAPKNCRYIMLVISHGGNWTHLAEFVAYSHADAVTRYAQESADELVPDPDDDDTYYEDTEYLRPMQPYDSWYNEGWYNNVTCTQSNEDNPSEWTYETTGGDSWVPLAPLEKDAPGPVLVFHYKSTSNLTCEFFWCAGGFPNNLAGGCETAFGIKKNSDWKTLTTDMSSAWSTHGWPGKAGDGVRFDIGDGAGETVVIRLMHWRAAD